MEVYTGEVDEDEIMAVEGQDGNQYVVLEVIQLQVKYCLSRGHLFLSVKFGYFLSSFFLISTHHFFLVNTYQFFSFELVLQGIYSVRMFLLINKIGLNKFLLD